MKKAQKLYVEQLEQRDALSATVTLSAAGVLNITSDNRGDYLVVSQPSTTTVELLEAETKTVTDFPAASVKSLAFTGGINGDTFYNNTSLPSTQKGNNANPHRVDLLVGGTGNDVITGTSNPLGATYIQDPGGINTLTGGAGVNNIFGGSGADTITASGTYNAVYDILGSNSVTSRAGQGYLLVNQGTVVKATKQESVVTFFQTFAGTSPAVLQKDINGNGILYLNPQSASVSYQVEQFGVTLFVFYRDTAGFQVLMFPKASVQWLAFFGGAGGNQVINDTDINSVFYGGKGADVLVGGSGINVLKGHSGNDTLVARGIYNDLSAGPGSSVLIGSSNGLNVYRNATGSISTQDYNAGQFAGYQDVVIGVPSLLAGSQDGVPFSDPSNDAGKPAASADFQQLFNDAI